MCAAVPAPVRAHGVEYAHDVEQRDGRVTVRFRSIRGGSPLAGAWVQVFAPADRSRPREEGRTDAGGRFAFRPDGAGTWRVRAVDGTGHGAAATIEVPAATAPAGGAPAPSSAAPATPGSPVAGDPGSASQGDAPRAGDPRSRVFGIAAAIVVAFALLAAFHRRRPGR